MEEFNNNNNQFDNQPERGENKEPENNVSSENVGGGTQSPYADVNPNENPNPYATSYNPYTSSYERYTESYNSPEQKQDKKGFGIAGMVLGIIGLVLCCVWYISLPCAIIGLILSIISQHAKSNGFALAGIITCAFSIAFSLLIGVSVFAILIEAFKEMINDQSGLDSLPDSSGDSSSYDHNYGAVINLFNYIKSIFKR